LDAITTTARKGINMKSNKYEKSVVDFAYEIIAMQEEILFLQEENERLKEYKAKYTKLLDDSIKHGHKMMGNVLSAYLKPQEMG
jgi:hypothetical protein